MKKLTVNRGTDILMSIDYTDENDAPADLTGYTFSVFEPSSSLEGRVTITPDDLTAGLISVSIAWLGTIDNTIKHSFRIQATINDYDVGSEEVQVIYT
jgi:hypothetical protein